jgi:hypothetical protein
MMDFAIGRIDRETEGFEGEIPEHGARLIAYVAGDPAQTVARAEMADAHDGVDDADPEEVATALEEDVVEILLKIAVLKKEHDLDIESAFGRRIETVEAFAEMQERLADAESDSEKREIIAEYVDKLDKEQFESMPVQTPDNMAQGVEAGTNVDAEGYEADRDRDKDVA